MAKIKIPLSQLQEMNQQRTNFKAFAYHVYVGAVLLVMNAYFYVFVHYKYDLSPNFAMAVFTVPVGIYELYKAIKIGINNRNGNQV